MQRKSIYFTHTFLFTLLITLLLTGCGGKKENITEDDREAAAIYDLARETLGTRNYNQAIVLYKALRNRFPFGRYAEQGQLDLAYAYHKAGEPENVSATVDRFIRTYPTHPNVDYAYYLRGLTYYEQNKSLLTRIFPERVSSRDQSLARTSFDGFSELVRRYPQSRYVPDARQRMVHLRNNLAVYEVTVADYYIRRKAYIAAVNRAKYVIENYPGTPASNEALVVLSKAYEKLELDELEQDARRILTLNDPLNPYLTGKSRDSSGFLKRLFSFGFLK